MTARSFDRIAWAAIAASLAYSVQAATSWDWFPTPGDWGHIARIPPSAGNYLALLLPPSTILACLLARRRRFGKKAGGVNDGTPQRP